jgi:hypothetical protein
MLELVGQPFELLAQAADFFFELPTRLPGGAALADFEGVLGGGGSPLIRWV